MLDLLRRWMDDYGELGRDDVVVVAYSPERLNDALAAGEVLAQRGIQVRSTSASSLLDPDTIDFVRTSTAQRVVLLCVQPGCVGIDAIGGFLSTCRRYGKDVALRTLADTTAMSPGSATPGSGRNSGDTVIEGCGPSV